GGLRGQLANGRLERCEPAVEARGVVPQAFERIRRLIARRDPLLERVDAAAERREALAVGATVAPARSEERAGERDRGHPETDVHQTTIPTPTRRANAAPPAHFGVVPKSTFGTS